MFCGFFVPVRDRHCDEVCFRDEAVWVHAKVPGRSGALSPECSPGEADPCCPRQCKYLLSA